MFRDAIEALISAIFAGEKQAFVDALAGVLEGIFNIVKANM